MSTELCATLCLRIFKYLHQHHAYSISYTDDFEEQVGSETVCSLSPSNKRTVKESVLTTHQQNLHHPPHVPPPPLHRPNMLPTPHRHLAARAPTIPHPRRIFRHPTRDIHIQRRGPRFTPPRQGIQGSQSQLSFFLFHPIPDRFLLASLESGRPFWF
jgi:hypothetical protein